MLQFLTQRAAIIGVGSAFYLWAQRDIEARRIAALKHQDAKKTANT